MIEKKKKVVGFNKLKKIDFLVYTWILRSK
jgi:hypothetical protein